MGGILQEGDGPRGREGVCGELGNLGGGLNIFVWGRNVHQVLLSFQSRKKKTNKHKEFWRDTPWFVSRLSPGHVPSVLSYVPSVPRTFCPLNVNFHINRPKRPGCPWDVPALIPGTLPGHFDH